MVTPRASQLAAVRRQLDDARAPIGGGLAPAQEVAGHQAVDQPRHRRRRQAQLGAQRGLPHRAVLVDQVQGRELRDAQLLVPHRAGQRADDAGEHEATGALQLGPDA